MTSRLFAIYAVATLIPVVALGLILAAGFGQQADQRGINEGRAEATLIAQTAVEPVLDGRLLSARLTPTEWAGLSRLVDRSVGHQGLLRLRVRDLGGQVVFSDDGSGFKLPPDDESRGAATGHVVTRLTNLNADGAAQLAVRTQRRPTLGQRAVEVYLPLRAGVPARSVGVLELYLSYAPISRDVSSLLNTLYLDLAVGLTVLYLTLFAITASVSRRLRRQATLNAFLAEYDTLTGLPNRSLFHRRAAATMRHAQRNDKPVALAIVDLDRFKDINDTLGHHNGDLVLTEIARRLTAALPASATVARLGGHEFGLLLTHNCDAEQLLWQLRRVLDAEVQVSGLALSVQASIGYALVPEDGTEVDTLLQHADLAMHVAKAKHADVMRYDASIPQYDAAGLSLVSELRHAIDNDQLVLHYQPQQDLADGRVTAVEALVRWRHPTRGLLYPDKFLALAEQTNVIDKLTSWVLRRALSDIRDLGAAGDRLNVAVNVSARSIGRPALANDVIQVLSELSVPAERLVIEVTETAILADPERAATEMARLAAAGVKISIDDFGRGQTSLAYLANLPIDELKIDRSFVTDMLDNCAHAAIVRSIVDLGHNLRMRVVAEGVETDDVLQDLRLAGCDIAQGFLLARPMPRVALADWLTPVRERVPALSVRAVAERL